MTATVRAFPIVKRPHRRKIDRSRSATIIILPVIRIERCGEPDKPPRVPKYEDMRP